MSTLSQFAGGSPTRSIVNAHSSGGASSGSMTSGSSQARRLLSGSLTANTLSTLVSVSQGGQIPYLTVWSNNATSRTIRLVVICDGVTVFDATSNTISGAGTGMLAAGSYGGSGWTDGAPIRFNSSCLIRVASSLTETDGIGIDYKLI